jgi:hypothetical protein
VAQGDFVAFVDDDEIVDEHWLTELVGGFTVAGRVACVTGLIVPLEMETPAQGWFDQFGGYCKGACTRHIFNLTDHRPKGALYPYSVGMLGSGGNMALRRSVLHDLGGFDPALGPGMPTLGGEDIEMLLRVVLAGHTLVYEPAAIVHHPSHRDYARLRKQIYGYGAGLAACLFRSLLAHPRLLPGFIAKVPTALVYTFSPQSAHHANKQPDYPSELTWLERQGMLYGPLAYLRSRGKLGQYARGGRLSEDAGIEAVTRGEASQESQPRDGSEAVGVGWSGRAADGSRRATYPIGAAKGKNERHDALE